MVTEKKCGRCGDVKPSAQFNKDKYAKTGLRSQCIECMTKERKRLRKHYKQWRERDEVKAKYRAYRKEHYDDNRKKVSARNKANHAVRTGAIVRRTCENCISTEAGQAHHNDYNKPLNVTWLCPACHKQWHKDNGEGANA